MKVLGAGALAALMAVTFLAPDATKGEAPAAPRAPRETVVGVDYEAAYAEWVEVVTYLAWWEQAVIAHLVWEQEVVAALAIEEAARQEAARQAAARPRTSSPPSVSSGARYDPGDGSVWDRLAQCESGGNWGYNGPSGFDGGLQFLPSTWTGAGGGEYAPYAHQATREQQIAVAERVLASGGWGQWPACSRSLGLR